MVDVVANSMSSNVPIEELNPFNEEMYYHEECQIEDWENQWEVENCRNDSLDLDQSNPVVRSFLLDWVKETVEEYGFDGIRIDDAIMLP